MTTERSSIKSLATVADEALKYIRARQSGKEKSLKVASEKVNKTFLNGFDWNRIVTVAGLSASGKSTLVRSWVREMIDLNPTESFDVLSFQFEMLAVDEIARDFSSAVDIDVKTLYSAYEPLDGEKLIEVEKSLESLRKRPIFIVDQSMTVDEMADTIIGYAAENNLLKKRKGLIVTIDNTLLVKDGSGKGEKSTIDELMFKLVELKKQFSANGGKCLFFVISQLNREIEKAERIKDRRLHYPNKSDIFGASSVFNASDYVVIIHKPVLVEGLGVWYGPPKRDFPQGLPVFNPTKPDQAMIYLHVIKERFGKPKILAMVDNLNRASISDWEKQ